MRLFGIYQAIMGGSTALAVTARMACSSAGMGTSGAGCIRSNLYSWLDALLLGGSAHQGHRGNDECGARDDEGNRETLS